MGRIRSSEGNVTNKEKKLIYEMNGEEKLSLSHCRHYTLDVNCFSVSVVGLRSAMPQYP